MPENTKEEMEKKYEILIKQINVLWWKTLLIPDIVNAMRNLDPTTQKWKKLNDAKYLLEERIRLIEEYKNKFPK